MTPVRLEPAAPLSRVKHSTTEPLRSHSQDLWSFNTCWIIFLLLLLSAFFFKISFFQKILSATQSLCQSVKRFGSRSGRILCRSRSGSKLFAKVISRQQWVNCQGCKKWDKTECTGLRRAVGKVSGNRCKSDCRSRGREFDPGPVPYFRGDWLWNNFYGYSPPFRWIIQGLLSVTSESVCTKYWLNACSSMPRKKVWLGELTVPPWPYCSCWLGK